MTKRVLMIAYHFPPVKGSSGVQRTLKFCQYLPQFGWEPVVLTVNERAYETTSQEQMGDIAPGIIVKRALAVDSARHLSILGFYPRLIAIPDRWISWLLGGLISGLHLIHRCKPEILWSTYPIATAHLIAYALHRLTGLPWVVDLRDPMVQADYPANPLQWKAFKWIEDRIARHATAICFTSPSAIDEFMAKHSSVVERSKLHLIENGYDEECFVQAESRISTKPTTANRKLILIHSGVIYPSERDPRPFFEALSKLKQSGSIQPESIHIIFRATGHDDYLSTLIQSAGLEDIIELAPSMAYIDALAEMLSADGLILFQAANCNYQIPAKLYEYIRAGCPIFSLTDAQGDTAKILQKFPQNTQADITSSTDIGKSFPLFLNSIAANTIASPSNTDIEALSRREKTRELAKLLNSVASKINA